jgi:opacity protein-like surface antigen
MKKLLAGLAALLPAITAAAADPAASGQTDWTGAYGGAFLGRAWAASSFTDVDGFVAGQPVWSTDYDDEGLVLGFLLGINGQTNNLVYGIEVDAALSVIETSAVVDLTSGDETVSSHYGLLATLRGRIGLAVANLHLFGIAGHARGRTAV